MRYTTGTTYGCRLKKKTLNIDALKGESYEMYVIKKDGTHEEFNVNKIIIAVNKSAARILYQFTEDELQFLCDFARDKAESLKKDGISIQEMQ